MEEYKQCLRTYDDLIDFKTKRCEIHHKEDKVLCFNYHKSAKKRRAPISKGEFVYSTLKCPSNDCDDRKCIFAHNDLEINYHPMNLKKKVCNNVEDCSNNLDISPDDIKKKFIQNLCHGFHSKNEEKIFEQKREKLNELYDLFLKKNKEQITNNKSGQYAHASFMAHKPEIPKVNSVIQKKQISNQQIVQKEIEPQNQKPKPKIYKEHDDSLMESEPEESCIQSTSQVQIVKLVEKINQNPLYSNEESSSSKSQKTPDFSSEGQRNESDSFEGKPKNQSALKNIKELKDKQFEQDNEILQKKKNEKQMVQIKQNKKIEEQENISQQSLPLQKKSDIISSPKINSTQLKSFQELKEKVYKKEYYFLGQSFGHQESQFLEFKDFSFASKEQQIRNYDNLLSRTLGFLNSKGGFIILGIDDNQVVRGTKQSVDEIEKILEQKFLGCEPRISSKNVLFKEIKVISKNDQQSERNKLIVIEIQPVKGLKYFKYQDSYQVRSFTTVQNLGGKLLANNIKAKYKEKVQELKERENEAQNIHKQHLDQMEKLKITIKKQEESLKAAQKLYLQLALKVSGTNDNQSLINLSKEEKQISIQTK